MLIYDENLTTSREGICDAQYMTFSIFVINVVLWWIFDDSWWKHIIDYNIFFVVWIFNTEVQHDALEDKNDQDPQRLRINAQ
jgi:hypothetical protein